MKIGFGEGKDRVFVVEWVKDREILFDFVREKVGDFNGGVGVFGFGRSNEMVGFERVIGFIDCECLVMKVEMWGSER